MGSTCSLKISPKYRDHVESITVDILRKNNK